MLNAFLATLTTVTALVVLLLTLAAVAAGYALSRRFVRERLRFVDAVQRGTAPWIAAAGALLIGGLAALVLPFVGAGAAVSFAVAVGLGVAAGARDIRRGNLPVRWG